MRLGGRAVVAVCGALRIVPDPAVPNKHEVRGRSTPKLRRGAKGLASGVCVWGRGWNLDPKDYL